MLLQYLPVAAHPAKYLCPEHAALQDAAEREIGDSAR